jgi:hypothetical protein
MNLLFYFLLITAHISMLSIFKERQSILSTNKTLNDFVFEDELSEKQTALYS